MQYGESASDVHCAARPGNGQGICETPDWTDWGRWIDWLPERSFPARTGYAENHLSFIKMTDETTVNFYGGFLNIIKIYE